MNGLNLRLFKELIEVKKGIEEIVIILSFFGWLRIKNGTREVVGSIGKAGIEVCQHSCKSLVIIVVIAKIEEGCTGGGGFEIWHAMIDINILNARLDKIEFGGDGSRAGIALTTASHTTLLLRRLARLVLIVRMSLKMLFFEYISCFLEMAFSLLISQLPLLSEYNGLQVISKVLEMVFGTLTNLIVVEGRILGSVKRMVALAI